MGEQQFRFPTDPATEGHDLFLCIARNPTL